MESKTFWKDDDWAADPQFEEAALAKLLDHKPAETGRKSIAAMLRQYRRSMLLNAFFLLLTAGIYLYTPKPDLLLPIGLIVSCFIYLLVHVYRAARSTAKQADLGQDVKTAILETVAINRKLHAQMCGVNNWILTGSFASGFLLGMLMGDWTLSKFAEKPIAVVVWIILTIGFHFYTRTPSFQKFQRSLNPAYYRAKKHLEEQLAALEE